MQFDFVSCQSDTEYHGGKMRSFAALIIALIPCQVPATPAVQLVPSHASPQLVGTPVTWTAVASDATPGMLSYRFTVVKDSLSRIVRDFSQNKTFAWASAIAEGTYRIQVDVRNNASLETAVASVPFDLVTRVGNGVAVVAPAANPLVALVSAPPCPSGSQVRVRFQPAAGGAISYTGWRTCDPAASSNIYVAGMRANTNHLLSLQTKTGRVITNGQTLAFKTGSPPSNIPTFTVPQPANAQSSLQERIVLWDLVNLGIVPRYPVATDLQGNVLWYYADLNDPRQAAALLTRTMSGGSMLLLVNGANSSSAATTTQVLREIDVAGNTVRETNATRLQEQLADLGKPSDCRSGGSICMFGNFHHELIRLPNGHTMAFGNTERMFPAGTQGSTVPVNVVGLVIVELDLNFQVVWYWDAFDHIDVGRAAVLDEKCMPTAIACPPLFLTPTGNDWLHANTLQLTADGNLLVSLRHQDWLLKIDYQNGAGSGDVLWRLGNGGDFSLVSNDPWPWFSHQHDSAFESDGTLTVFDNGNTRVAQSPGQTQNSRGQAYIVDEANRVARQILNADLGVYSAALGSAQRLLNGNFHFLAGFNSGPVGNFSQSVEVLPTGEVNFRQQTNFIVYRSFRMRNLYVPPEQ